MFAKPLYSRTPLFLLERATDVFDVCPTAEAFLVDLEGTLTGFSPSLAIAVEAITNFDLIGLGRGVFPKEIQYLTNATFQLTGQITPAWSARFHSRAHKPFFVPPAEFRNRGPHTVVVGDQYLTDGLLAWRFGFSFGLVRAVNQQPLWPSTELSIGRWLSPLFFTVANGSA